MAYRCCFTAFFVFFGSHFVARGEHAMPGSHRSAFLAANDKNVFRDTVHEAVAAALGSVHDFNRGHLGEVRDNFIITWQAIAKNKYGRIDRRTLRYVVHRYLLKMRSVSIIGLEPLQSGMSSVDGSLLTLHAPEYLQKVLNESDQVDGFSLDDTVAMIAMLEELVTRAGHQRLDVMFSEKKWPTSRIQSDLLQSALQTYLVRWIMGNDTESIRILEANRHALRETFEDWDGMVELVKGRILQFKRSRAAQLWKNQPESTGRMTWHPFGQDFSFQDVQSLAGDLVLTFGRYWHAECERVKTSLQIMDYSMTGRVKLADFHHAASQGEWRFSESREYLRSLGALDESSTALGPRVIIPNYLQSASNCIVGDEHYRVCCANDCESVMTEIEESVQSPTASAGKLLDLVRHMTFNLEDDQPKIPSALRQQLIDIAETHHGQIPIHGRLFAQWLHYVFPRDCPFPHKGGTVSSLAPHEFGNGFMVSNAELDSLAGRQHNASVESIDVEEWMTQWSNEEDLVSSSLHLQAPWERRALRVGARATFICVLILAVGILSVVSSRAEATGKLARAAPLLKEHYV
jgi:hypothetical protein